MSKTIIATHYECHILSFLDLEINPWLANAQNASLKLSVVKMVKQDLMMHNRLKKSVPDGTCIFAQIQKGDWVVVPFLKVTILRL